MRASFYECDVTPPLGGFLWGHYGEVYAKEVHNRLYAKAVVVEDEGDVAAIVVIDSCTLPPEMHDIVTKRIEEYTGITADKVCIASNHAHWGAPISDSPEIGCYADENYKDVFFRLVADAVIIAYKRLDDATVKFGNSIAPGLAFCRNFELEDGTYVCHGRNRTNIKKALAEPDEELPVLLFEKDGKPIGAVICYACHQCTVGKPNGVTGYSGDYASVMSEILKERYGHDFVSLFLIGTCGDVNHVNPDVNEPVTNFKIIGEKLADYYENSKDAAVPLTEGGVKSVKEFIDIKRRDASLEANKDKLVKLTKAKSYMRLRNMLYYVSKAEPEYTSLAVQCIKIGDTLIACLPGEQYTEYGRKIKAASPFKNTIVVENCNTYCGYIPSESAFDPEHDDLYETSLCYHSCHVPEAGNILSDKALELANNIK